MIVDLEHASDAHGGKASGLGRALRAGFSVPPGVVVPAEMPWADVARALPGWVEDAVVAVRSSRNGEDSRAASGAGIYESVLGIRGRAAVAVAVRAVRRSATSARASAYGAPAEPMHAIVQRQVFADLGGVLFSDGNKLVVESAAGGPSGVVSGTVTPRRHLVSDQDDHGPGWLDDVVALGRTLAAQLGHEVDVEWAVEADRLWLLQVRPVTVRLVGTAGSPGVATGPVRLVNGPEDFERVRPGDVLVCRTTDPAWIPLLSVVSAVVTEVGGILSHAAIVARERGVPAVVGLAGIRRSLHDDQRVTVDGGRGTVTPVARDAFDGPRAQPGADA